MLTCSLEVEIAAIALAMERAAHYYFFTTMKKEHEKLWDEFTLEVPIGITV